MTYLRNTPDHVAARLALATRCKTIERQRDAALLVLAFLISAGIFRLVFAGV